MKKIFVLLAVFAVVFVGVMFLFSHKTEAASADELATAFGATGLTSSSYSGNTQANSVMNAFGNIVPREGSTFAVLSTGIADATDTDTDFPPAGPVGDSTTLTLNFTVPAGMNSLLLNFYFLSREYPDYVGTLYNDTFTATIDGSSKVAGGTNFAKDPDGHVIDINSVTFAVTGTNNDLLGTAFEDHGGTGWVMAGAPVAPGDVITLTFNVQDLEDGIYNSTVLLDNFRFDQGSLEAGVQSKYFFSQSNVNITDCTGRATLNLYSSTVVRSATTVDIGNSDPNVLALSTNQLTIPQYQSKTSDNLQMQGQKNGSVTLTASGAGIGLGTTTITVSGCPIGQTLPETGSNKNDLIQSVNSSLPL